LAEDRGPDIFSIHNTWVKEYLSKIRTMPPTISMVFPIQKGRLKKEIIPEIRESRSITIKEINDKYVDVVQDDVVVKIGKGVNVKEYIYGLPYSVDTLAMYYNKDLFNNAGIANPSMYWDKEFQQNVKKLTKQNTKGQIIQSGAALGGGTNIDRYSDILSLLMMQNGTEMMEGTRIKFQNIPEILKNQGYNPGVEAVKFYTDFANPAKEVYSWNDSMDNALDMFINGKLAIMFGYSYHMPVIKSRAPKLNFSVAPMPQIEGNDKSVNFANYWVETVSKKSNYPNEAWDFIQFTAKEENVKNYLNRAKKPTALRALVDKQKEDFDIGVFVEQVLTAKSWYQGKDAVAMESLFAEMINKAIANPSETHKAISLYAKLVQQTIE